MSFTYAVKVTTYYLDVFDNYQWPLVELAAEGLTMAAAARRLKSFARVHGAELEVFTHCADDATPAQRLCATARLRNISGRAHPEKRNAPAVYEVVLQAHPTSPFAGIQKLLGGGDTGRTRCRRVASGRGGKKARARAA